VNAPLAITVALACLLCSTQARADDHPRVELVLDPCVDAPHEDIRRVVAIELGALLTDAGDAGRSGAPTDRTRATVTCDGAVVLLRVDDPLTGKSLSRTVDLGAAIPKARARLVALAVVELISASWTELDVNPQPRVPPSGPRPSLAARDAALATVRAQTDRRDAAPLRILAIAGGMKFFSGTALLGGGGLRASHDGQSLGWSIDGQVHHGTSRVSLGEVSTDVVDVGAAVTARQTWSRWSLRLGAGARGGAARLSGSPDPSAGTQGKKFWAPWIGPLALGRVELVVTDRLVLDVGIEGGYVVSPVGGLVADRREVAVDGPWMAVDVGVGMYL
jgi:hypothetical protein